MAGTKRKRVHRTRAEITEIREAFDVSGMSAVRFAAANDLPISTFRLWLRRRTRESAPASPSAGASESIRRRTSRTSSHGPRLTRCRRSTSARRVVASSSTPRADPKPGQRTRRQDVVRATLTDSLTCCMYPSARSSLPQSSTGRLMSSHLEGVSEGAAVWGPCQPDLVSPYSRAIAASHARDRDRWVRRSPLLTLRR